MHRYLWALLLFVVVGLRSSNGIADAIGNTFGWLLIGLIVVVVWWLIARKSSSKDWRWFNWLNATSCVMAFLLSLNALISQWAQTQITSQSSARLNNPNKAVDPNDFNKIVWDQPQQADPPGTRYVKDRQGKIHRLVPVEGDPFANPSTNSQSSQ